MEVIVDDVKFTVILSDENMKPLLGIKMPDQDYKMYVDLERLRAALDFLEHEANR